MKEFFVPIEKTLRMRIDNPVLAGPPGILFAVCLALLLFARLASAI